MYIEFTSVMPTQIEQDFNMLGPYLEIPLDYQVGNNDPSIYNDWHRSNGNVNGSNPNNYIHEAWVNFVVNASGHPILKLVRWNRY